MAKHVNFAVRNVTAVSLSHFYMVLFISDIHLGQSGRSVARRQEADLIYFLRAVQDDVEHLYLLGDVFEDYIEYRHLIPKGFARFQGLLADWADAGIRVTYLVGNHDPWHQSYFEREIGVAVEHDVLIAKHHGRGLYLAHGDGIFSPSKTKAWLQKGLRHPVPVWIYRHVLPGDIGISLARLVNSTFGKHEVDRALVEGLRARAHEILRDSRVDAVIFGHSHYPEFTVWPEGQYLNTGCWHESRTFGAQENGALRLMRWNGQSADIVER